MTLGERLRRLDQRALKQTYSPKPDADRAAYLRQGSDGLTGLGYAESGARS